MPDLLADQFHKDARVLKAKQLIRDALYDCQNKITGIRKARHALEENYQNLLKQFGVMRGNPLYFPYLGSGFGKGALVELADGSIKYDFIAGIGVHYWGHSHPKIISAGVDAALEDIVLQGNLQQNIGSVKLVELLLNTATSKGAKLEHCFLTTSGAMANENALKIILHKKHPAYRILCFENSFSGRTLAMASLTDNAAYRSGLPNILRVDYLPFFDEKHPKESTCNSVGMLKKYLFRYPEQYACMCFELVQGEGGAYPGNRRFFTALMDVLKEHKIAILIDEVQTFARTSEIFAFQHFGLDNYVDVVTVGKTSHVCATLFSDSYNPKPGIVSQTFTSSSSAVKSAQVMIEHLVKSDYFGKSGKIMQCHEYLTNYLDDIAKRFPNTIHGPYGLGAMIGFSVFDGSLEITKTFVQALFQAGVISFVAGKNPVRVRFLLPIGAITLEDIDLVAEKLESTIEKVGKRSGLNLDGSHTTDT